METLTHLQRGLLEENVDDMSIFEEYTSYIDHLYVSSKDSIRDIVSKGISKDGKSINYQEWVVFAAKMLPKIDSYPKLSGDEKKTLLIYLVIFIIVKHFSPDPFTAGLIIAILKVFLPAIIDAIVQATKKMHSWWGKNKGRIYRCIRRKLCCCICSKK